MPEAATQPEPQVSASPDPGGSGARSESLTPDAIRAVSWHSPLAPEMAVDALRSASRRGKLAGFRTLEVPPRSGGQAGPGVLHCVCDIFGSPYDRDLFIAIEPAGTGSAVRLDTRLRRKFPVIVIVVMLLAMWPGVWLTDSLLVTYFDWYPRAGWVTTAWYIPLMLLSIPVLIKQYRNSEASAAKEAGGLVRKLRKLTNAG